MTRREKACGLVAIVGRPNVGKSTLINRLVGYKVAIVSDVPQTTRRRIRGVCNRPGGQIVLVDTPGIHKPRHAMNRSMVAEASGAMVDVDLVVFMIEATDVRGRPARDLGPGDRHVLDRLPHDGPPVLLAVNKVDRVKRTALLPLIDRVRTHFPFKEILLLSALTGEGAETIPEVLLAHLPEGSPLYPEDQPTDETIRSLAEEIVREKLLHHTRQEIPHETCVLIDLFDEAERMTRIEATILVDRESQKPILIGREGQQLKTIGSEARTEIEELLGRKVFLKLWVKVKEGWRDDRGVLRRLGLRHTPDEDSPSTSRRGR